MFDEQRWVSTHPSCPAATPRGQRGQQNQDVHLPPGRKKTRTEPKNMTPVCIRALTWGGIGYWGTDPFNTIDQKSNTDDEEV